MMHFFLQTLTGLIRLIDRVCPRSAVKSDKNRIIIGYTLKKDMKYLTDEGLLKKMGKARATIYVIREKKK